MSELADFKMGEEVFVLDSPSEWLAVKVVGLSRDGSIRVRVADHMGIPGYIIGETYVVAADLIAHRALTVEMIRAMREERER